MCFFRSNSSWLSHLFYNLFSDASWLLNLLQYPKLAQKHRQERFTATDYRSSKSTKLVFTVQTYTKNDWTVQKPKAPRVGAGSLSLCLVEMLQLWSKDALCLFQCRFARLLPDILRVGVAARIDR